MDQPALYRKYRPTTFAEVVGQDQVVAVLEGALIRNQIVHAYLFAGSRGTGKTSVARILARRLGTSPNDLYEIDAASNRGIDEIRELREAVRTFPFESKYKIYIVDEVHMLTREAFNALLKTLEEPPDHVIFILATTEVHKLPETIISRCQTLTFRQPPVEALVEVLKRVAKAEGWQVAAEAATLLALLGDSSFRDALGVLQQVMSVTKGKVIGLAAVEQATGAPRHRLVELFLAAAAAGNLEQILGAVRQTTAANHDLKIWLKLIMRQLRLALILKFAPALGQELTASRPAAELKFLAELTRAPAAAKLVTLLRELLTVYDELDRATLPELPLELVLIKLFGQDPKS
ncbi:MAG: DNA polymerase III subunit gamma/tau [Candidatus Vogelbacteria bacterium]|nr:DNA polymerase III subunit gamma/tau [Candidatus Vogelbacteria bacterium]